MQIRGTFLLISLALFFLLNYSSYVEAKHDDKLLQVFRQLVNVIPDPKDYAQLTIFLCKHVDLYNYVHNLYDLVNSKKEFKQLALALLKKAKKEDEHTIDPETARMWAEIAKSELSSDDPLANHGPKFNLDIEQYLDLHIPAYAISKALRAIPTEKETLIINGILKATEQIGGSNSWLFRNLPNVLPSVFDFQKEVTRVAIVLTVSYESWTNIELWWHNEISRKRCAKNIIDDIASAAGTIALSNVGANIGTAIFPGVGTVIGGLVGGITGGIAGGIFSDYLTQWIFDLALTVALENAYNFLDVSPYCTNEEVNKAYHQLALKYHPNKGGNQEKFRRLTISVALVKQSREEKQKRMAQKEDL